MFGIFLNEEENFTTNLIQKIRFWEIAENLWLRIIILNQDSTTTEIHDKNSFIFHIIVFFRCMLSNKLDLCRKLYVSNFLYKANFEILVPKCRHNLNRIT